MNALITGIVAFCFFALGVICPDDFIYVPSLLATVVGGGYVGGTMFSLQSDGVYALHIRALAGKEGVAGAVRRVAVCLGTLSVTVIGGFLGLKRGAADVGLRRAVVLWNLACYRTLASNGRRNTALVESVIELLNATLQSAPVSQERLATENLDRDLVPLLGDPAFERWRQSVLSKGR